MKHRCPTCGRTQQRSNAANRRYWALLTEISDRLKVDGRSLPPETWAEYFKKKFLGAQEFTLPGNEILVIPNSSAELDEAPFSDYLTQVEAWASDRGVFLPEREEHESI